MQRVFIQEGERREEFDMSDVIGGVERAMHTIFIEFHDDLSDWTRIAEVF